KIAESLQGGTIFQSAIQQTVSGRTVLYEFASEINSFIDIENGCARGSFPSILRIKLRAAYSLRNAALDFKLACPLECGSLSVIRTAKWARLQNFLAEWFLSDFP